MKQARELNMQLLRLIVERNNSKQQLLFSCPINNTYDSLPALLGLGSLAPSPPPIRWAHWSGEWQWHDWNKHYLLMNQKSIIKQFNTWIFHKHYFFHEKINFVLYLSWVTFADHVYYRWSRSIRRPIYRPTISQLLTDISVDSRSTIGRLLTGYRSTVDQ